MVNTYISYVPVMVVSFTWAQEWKKTWRRHGRAAFPAEQSTSTVQCRKEDTRAAVPHTIMEQSKTQQLVEATLQS